MIPQNINPIKGKSQLQLLNALTGHRAILTIKYKKLKNKEKKKYWTNFKLKIPTAERL